MVPKEPLVDVMRVITMYLLHRIYVSAPLVQSVTVPRSPTYRYIEKCDWNRHQLPHHTTIQLASVTILQYNRHQSPYYNTTGISHHTTIQPASVTILQYNQHQSPYYNTTGISHHTTIQPASVTILRYNQH